MRKSITLARLRCCFGATFSRAGFAATKTLHIAFTAAESTFDPAASDDIPSSDIIRMVFDPPLDYDYRPPVALKPATLAQMPEVSPTAGRTH